MCWDIVLTPPHDLLLQHVASLPPFLFNLSQKQLQKSLGLHLFLEEFYEQNITPTISPRGDLPQYTNYPTIYPTELKYEILYSHI